jgi:hypothetical protein
VGEPTSQSVVGSIPQLDAAIKGESKRSAASRRFCVMHDDHYLMMQASIICLLLFLGGTTAVIQHPGWFQ